MDGKAPHNRINLFQENEWEPNERNDKYKVSQNLAWSAILERYMLDDE